MLGMRVAFLNPIWNRTCKDCMTWVYGPDGEPMERPSGSGIKVANDNCDTPCSSCPKIPKGMPKDRRYAVELTDRDWAIYRHWRECRATNTFPDDPIVRRHAVIFQDIQDELDRQPLMQLASMLSLKRDGA